MDDPVRTEHELEPIPEPEALIIDVDEVTPGVAVVSLTGDIDMLTASRLRERLRPHLEPPARAIVLDLTQVDFLGSTALAELVAAHEKATANGVRLLLVAVTRTVLRPLEITGLRSLFGVFDTVDAAIDTIGNV